MILQVGKLVPLHGKGHSVVVVSLGQAAESGSGIDHRIYLPDHFLLHLSYNRDIRGLYALDPVPVAPRTSTPKLFPIPNVSFSCSSARVIFHLPSSRVGTSSLNHSKRSRPISSDFSASLIIRKEAKTAT